MVKRAASTTSTSTAPQRKVKKESEPVNEIIASISPSLSNNELPSIPVDCDAKKDIKNIKHENVAEPVNVIPEVKDIKTGSVKTESISSVNIETNTEEVISDIKEDVKKVRKTKAAALKPSWPMYLKEEYETTGKRVLSAVGSSEKFLGAHVSASGGIENAVYNAMAIGCRSFALFLKNQRTWNSKPIEEESIQRWHEAIKEADFDLKMIVPHGSYLLNAGSPNRELREKTKISLLDEIQRCERLGITLYNFHPGSSCGKCTSQESIAYIAEILDEVIEKTKDVTLCKFTHFVTL